MNGTGEIEGRLVEAGLAGSEASSKAALFGKAADALERFSGGPPAQMRRWFVPGRIEVLGKHTDYAGGRSLLCAVERGFCVVASGRSDRRVRILDAGRGLEAELSLDPDLLPIAEDWKVYPMVVARRMARDFPGALAGADIAFASDLPRAAGLSSSSALVIALFTALADLNNLDSRPEFASNIRSREDLAEYLGCLENGLSFGALEGDRGVGTFGGSEDHTAILCCRPGELAQYVFCPVRHERSVPLPGDWTFVIASSGVASDKTGSVRAKYNRLSVAASTILSLWREATRRQDPTLFAAATSAPDAPKRIREILRRSSHREFSAQVLLFRFDQFFEESVSIIPEATEALVGGDRAAFGELAARSQSTAERFLGNQIPETTGLVRLARSFGAMAASAFGGGFGGSVWALVSSGEAKAFRPRWAEGYARAFPASAARAEFVATRPGPALLRLDR
ncbi:MAG: galactokinase family protein [Thermoanaerobaculia bacterium]